MKKFCIIPAYNEEKRIESVVKRVANFVDEVIVINDGSNDNTALLAKKAGATVLNHIINRGQGAALQTGNDYALQKGADIVIHFDGDEQFQAEEIPKIIEPLINDKAEAVLGSRFLGIKSKVPAIKRLFILPIAKIINRLIFGIKFSDPQSGFRALSKKALQKIKIEHDGMAHCSEIMYKLHKKKIKTIEVPITVIYHEYGQKLSGGIRIIKDLIIKKIIK